MSTAAMDDKALLAVPERPPAPAAPMIVEVARKTGVTPFRQMRESYMLAFSRTRLKLHEYYSAGLFDPEIPMEKKREYVGLKGNWKLNCQLTPRKLATMSTFAGDKVLFTSLIRELGFRSTETQAVVSNGSGFGAIPALRSVDELHSFLTEKAVYPLFGKPQDFSGSFGSVLIEGLEQDELLLGNGQRISVESFCQEIMRDYAGGYLLQSALTQNAAVSEVAGDAIGSIRIATVRRSNQPEVLYSAWKIPAPQAMSDNFWQDGSMIAPIDIETGIVGQCRTGTGLQARDIDDHPVTGRAITGMQMPFWADATKAAREAHAIFPEFGVVGWDIAMTPEGPLIIECNTNPFHTLYQLAHTRGVLNDDFNPVFDAVAAYSKNMMENRKKAQKKRAAVLKKRKRKKL